MDSLLLNCWNLEQNTHPGGLNNNLFTILIQGLNYFFEKKQCSWHAKMFSGTSNRGPVRIYSGHKVCGALSRSLEAAFPNMAGHVLSHSLFELVKTKEHKSSVPVAPAAHMAVLGGVS